MAARKKTPDILGDLLGKSKKPQKKTKVEELRDKENQDQEPLATGLKKIEAKASISSTGVEDSQGQHFVTFRVAGRDYALPLEQVERSLRMVELVPVPEAPPWIAGLMNLHGRILPVLDLRVRFGSAPKDPIPDDRLLVVHTPQKTLTIMVDEVKDVLEIPVQQIERPSGSLARSRPLKGVIRHFDEMILVLDADHLEPNDKI